MRLSRIVPVFVLGAAVGGAFVGLTPLVRYDYARVGSDLQRVDRFSGRVEWAGDAGWWNPTDQIARIEAEASQFSTRAEEIALAAAQGRLATVRREGRQITVYPKVGEPYKAYAPDLADPRLDDLVAKLRSYGVRIG